MICRRRIRRPYEYDKCEESYIYNYLINNRFLIPSIKSSQTGKSVVPVWPIRGGE